VTPSILAWRDRFSGETLRTAVDALLAYKVRALLSMIGVVIGSASIVLVVTAGLTGGRYVTSQIEGVGSNIAYAQHVRGSLSANALSDELTPADLQAVRTAVPEVVDVAGSRDVSMTVVAGGHERDIALIGVTDGFQRIRHLVVVRGRYFDDSELASSNKVCLLTDELAAAMFPGSDPVGSIARIGELRLTVVGVFRERVPTFGASEVQRESVLVPFPLMKYITGTEYIEMLYAQASSPDSVAIVTQELGAVLRARHRAGARYEVENLTGLLTAAERISAALSFTLLTVAFIALLVSGIGIMNIMLVSVTERTREIGVRKAVGAPPRNIMGQFLVEAAIVSGLGAIGGVALAIGIVVLIRSFLPANMSLPISTVSVLLALTASAAVGLTFGYLPARRAANLPAVDALRYE
jgi:putative ABC transport system permease protein